jgi:hypothetical protein
VDLLGSKHLAADPLDDRLQQPDRLAYPIAQCRAVEVEPLASIDLALPIKRQMIGIFRHQHMRQHAGGGPPARCRQSWRRRLSDRVTTAAGIFRPDMPDHPEAAGDIVEDLGNVFAEPSHVTAADGTGAGAIVLRLVHDLLAGQVIRKLVALRSCPLAQRQRLVFGCSLADLFGLAGFQLLEPQLELLDLPGQPLRGAAELHPPQPGDLKLQLLDYRDEVVLRGCAAGRRALPPAVPRSSPPVRSGRPGQRPAVRQDRRADRLRPAT